MRTELQGSLKAKHQTVNLDDVGARPALGVVCSKNGLRATNDVIIEDLAKSGLYRVNQGLLETRQGWNSRMLDSWIVKKPYTAKGYPCIKYKQRHLLVHRVVYRLANGSINPDLVVDHIDNDRTNYHPSNLQQLTVSNNGKKAWKNPHNTRKKPIYNKKIDFIIANAIRSDRKRDMSYKALAKKYKLSKSNISYIVNNKTWVVA